MFEELEYKDKHLASHTVRLLSPMGLYPKEPVLNGDSLAYFGHDLCFILVPIDNIESDYSEVKWLKLNEIKLLSSMMLAIEQGMLLFHPHPHVHYLKVTSDSFNPEFVDSIRTHFFAAFDDHDIEDERHGFKYVTRTPYNLHSSVELPKIGENRYRFREQCVNIDVQMKLYAETNITDKLLMRALSTLLRSSLLMCYSHLLEEAINSTFISMDASFALVQRRLKEMGNPSPSSKDGAEFISHIFNTDSPEKYLQDYYERRIMAFHPSSRFGEFAHSPVEADDCYDLFDCLISIYRYLICGDVREES